MNNSLYRSFRRASLMLIFMISAGALAVILAGCYFIIANEGLLSGELVRQSKRLAVEQAADAIVKSELERVLIDLTGTDFQPALMASTPANYTSAISSALSWGLGSEFVNSISSVNVVFPDLGANPLFSKSNPVTAETEFIKNPCWRFDGYNVDGTVSADIELADSGKTVSYNRISTYFREIPVGNIPFTAAFQYKGSDLIYSTASATETAYGSGYIIPSLYAKGYDYGTSYTDPYFGSISPGSEPMYRYPSLLSTWGQDVDPVDICTYYSSSPGTNMARQNYSLDANVTVIEFNGSSLTLLSSPYGPSVSIPSSAITVGSFQGQSRVIFDMETMPVTGNYDQCKWYVHCTTAEAKAAGVVIKDTAVASALDNISVATDGHLYLCGRDGVTDRTPGVYATNYGGVGVVSSTFDDSLLRDATNMDLYPTGFISAYAKEEILLEDAFNRSGSIASSSPDTINTESLSWGAVTGTLTCSTTGGGELSSANNTADNYVAIPIPSAVRNSEAITVVMTVEDMTGSGATLEVSLADTATYDVNNRYSVVVDSTTPAYYIENISGGATVDSASPRAITLPAEIEMTFIPSVRQQFTKVNGSVLNRKRLTNSLPSFLPSYIFLKFNPGASGSVTVSNLKIVKHLYGTILTNPQTGTHALEFQGSVAVGDALSQTIAEDATINVLPTKAVTEEIEGLCERVLVHYPHFRKP